MKFFLRRVNGDDREFLYQLHCATMRDYIERTWGWDEEWQRTHIEARFVATMQQVIIVEGRCVGMIEADRRPDELFIANVQVLPAEQGRGIGGAVIGQLMADAARSGVPVTLQVLKINERARRLYERLGFVVTGQEPPHIQMRAGRAPFTAG